VAEEVTAERQSLFIATPCYGGMVHVSYMQSIIALTRTLDEHDVDYSIVTMSGESLITRARNSLVAQFLGSDCTHLFFIDSDISFSPESVLRMLSFDKEAVCGAYPGKKIVWDRVLEKGDEFKSIAELRAKCLNYNFEIYTENTTPTEPTKISITNGFIKVSSVGTGFMLLKRSVFEKMKVAYPERYVSDLRAYINDATKDNFYLFFECMVDGTSKRYLSEDYAFCRKWGAIGGEIWLDVVSPRGHTGSHCYQGHLQKTYPPGTVELFERLILKP